MKGLYQFLVDGLAPVPGPTDERGFYLFDIDGASNNNDYKPPRQSYPASVVGKVRNLKTKLHKIDVDIACIDVSQLGGCGVTAHWSTMRIDVFEP